MEKNYLLSYRIGPYEVNFLEQAKEIGQSMYCVDTWEPFSHPRDNYGDELHGYADGEFVVSIKFLLNGNQKIW